MTAQTQPLASRLRNARFSPFLFLLVGGGAAVNPADGIDCLWQKLAYGVCVAVVSEAVRIGVMAVTMPKINRIFKNAGSAVRYDFGKADLQTQMGNLRNGLNKTTPEQHKQQLRGMARAAAAIVAVNAAVVTGALVFADNVYNALRP